MGLNQLPCFVAGRRVDPPDGTPFRVESIDQSLSVSAAVTSPTGLRAALRFAGESQYRLNCSPLSERTQVVQSLIRLYYQRRHEVAWALAHFRGIVRRDADWMSEVLSAWGSEIPKFLTLAGVVPGDGESVQNLLASRRSRVLWRSRGPATLLCSSTMDGPPAVATLCHAILSGTHVIMRPSWRDAVTHFAFEALAEMGFGHYAQLVRWPSGGKESGLLNRQMLRHTSQSLIFSSNETYSKLLSDAADPCTDEWLDLQRRSRRYGTGLPLVIVTPNANLDRVADQLVEGARKGNGRFCMSTGPVLVAESCYDALLPRLVSEVARLVAGDLHCSGTDIGRCALEERRSLEQAISRFGGRVSSGRLSDESMNVLIVSDVPRESPCLAQEYPGPALFLIRVRDRTDAITLAQDGLRRNSREAWTSITTQGDEEDFAAVSNSVSSYRHVRGGVTTEVDLCTPHQGSYFLLDLMLRSVLGD